jgi:hypothetical protein
MGVFSGTVPPPWSSLGRAWPFDAARRRIARRQAPAPPRHGILRANAVRDSYDITNRDVLTGFCKNAAKICL